MGMASPHFNVISPASVE